ncbi:hypothetical protein E2C01_035026 [Portunus trituberculatus]|uniref:Uncharacterized protein n=1 Tax=Portunus trituberculatus TaxID=210409 RepID=A0A5B7F761_PORTR|nr:hypothetical protein [Portunus trituberculatus]
MSFEEIVRENTKYNRGGGATTAFAVVALHDYLAEWQTSGWPHSRRSTLNRAIPSVLRASYL